MFNPAKEALIACNVTLCDFVSVNAVVVSNKFWSDEIIPLDLHREVVSEPHRGAEKIVNHLIDRVGIDGDFFQKILGVLESLDCSDDVTGMLYDSYSKFSPQKQHRFFL